MHCYLKLRQCFAILRMEDYCDWQFLVSHNLQGCFRYFLFPLYNASYWLQDYIPIDHYIPDQMVFRRIHIIYWLMSSLQHCILLLDNLQDLLFHTNLLHQHYLRYSILFSMSIGWLRNHIPKYHSDSENLLQMHILCHQINRL